MKIADLLSDITPLYNRYKNEKGTLPANISVCIMWEIGFFIDEYLQKNKVSPHNLYREIYGKSESKVNISQKSYITREFLSRCFRIYKMFIIKDDIFNVLPNLKDFSSFREAMPFFDNPDYKLSHEGQSDLIKLLNSDKKGSQVVSELDKLKKSIKDISNPRSQKLGELDNDVKIFKSFYNFLFNVIKDSDYETCLSILEIDTNHFDILKVLSQNTSSLAQEGVSSFYMNEVTFTNELLFKFYDLINKLIKPVDEKVRRRFRRLIPPERMIKISDYIFALLSSNNFTEIKSKIK